MLGKITLHAILNGGQLCIFTVVTAVNMLEYNRELFTNMPPIIHYLSANLTEYLHDIYSHRNFPVQCLVSASEETAKNEEP